MSTPFLIVTRFSELILTGKVDSASAYLDENVILQSWQGVVEGKMDVVNYLNDSRRFMHHKRSFRPWRQVIRSMEKEAEKPFQGDYLKKPSGITNRSEGLPSADFSSGSQSYVSERQEKEYEDDYDGQGYVIYERLGTMSTRPRFSVKTIHVRESIAVCNNLIVLIVFSKQGFL